MRLAYITATASAFSATTPRSCVMSRIDIPRSRWSFNFQNYGADHDFSFGQFEQVFGYDAMHLKIDLCEGTTLGLAHCPIVTPIPDPVAAILVVALKGHSKEGLCYGFSRTAAQFMAGASFSQFPPYNDTYPNGLDKSQALVDVIEANHIQQWDQNLIVAHAVALVDSGPEGAGRRFPRHSDGIAKS